MIVYDLHCAHGHRFEGWFSSSSDFEDQQAGGLLVCPVCGALEVTKAPMAPAVPVKGNARREQASPAPEAAAAAPVANTPMPPQVREAMAKLAEAQAKALAKSTWVGADFAEQSRAMHYGERDEAPIHGQASLAEARSLIEEGVPVAPLPFPVAPPEKAN
ncbi:MAG: DUF1178 family protein [Erythrobacter sp.]|jgi:hypothetical protein|nr:DUF1178 family protein [Erythrobacter sp.]